MSNMMIKSDWSFWCWFFGLIDMMFSVFRSFPVFCVVGCDEKVRQDLPNLKFRCSIKPLYSSKTGQHNNKGCFDNDKKIFTPSVHHQCRLCRYHHHINSPTKQTLSIKYKHRKDTRRDMQHQKRVPKRRPFRRFASNLDMYRKVPIDLLEGTKRGSIISLVAMMVMVILFFCETFSFLASNNVRTDVTLDLNKEKKVRVNFNITMMDLKCDYVVIDVVSQLGTEQNVTSNVMKYSLDAKGVRDRYKGRNKEQHDIIMSDSLVTETLEELHENGEDAVSLDADTLKFALEENTYLFVDFYASWCSHCRDLAPTWEVLAEAMTDTAISKVEAKWKEDHQNGHKHPDDYTDEEYEEAMAVELPVFVAKIDCVVHKQLCFDQQIWAYPTLRLFIEGEPKADYRGDRTVLEMIHWLSMVEQAHKQYLGEDKFHLIVADQSK